MKTARLKIVGEGPVENVSGDALAVVGILALVADLPRTRAKQDGDLVETYSGIVAVPPRLARSILARKTALTRAIDAKHVSALRQTMAEGRWIADTSVIQLHVASAPEAHLFVVDGAHRLAAIAQGKAPFSIMLVVRHFATADRARDVETYDAVNAQKAQSLAARAKTIARRTAPDGWAEAEVDDKPAIRGAVRYGTLVQQGHRFAARKPARNLPMTKVMDAAFEVFPHTRHLSLLVREGGGPAAKLLASDGVMAFLALAAKEGLDAAGFVRAALETGPIQRELVKVGVRKSPGASHALLEIQAVAAALLWRSGIPETEALRSVYQDRRVDVGDVTVTF